MQNAKINVSVKCLRDDFLQFSSAIVKTFISVGQLGTSLNSKHFRDFPEIS